MPHVPARCQPATARHPSPRCARRLLALAATAVLAAAPLHAQPARAAIPRAVVAGGGGRTGSPVLEVLVTSPSHARTALQVLCLFAGSPGTPLRASLASTDSALHGLLAAVRSPARFSGTLGETLVLASPPGTLPARRVLLIGLGDAETFTPERMRLVGRVLAREADRLGVAHPFFAPAVIDGGVTRFPADAVSEQVALGIRDAHRLARWLAVRHAGPAPIVTRVTFLAGPTHAMTTVTGIRRALADTTTDMAGAAPDD